MSRYYYALRSEEVIFYVGSEQDVEILWRVIISLIPKCWFQMSSEFLSQDFNLKTKHLMDKLQMPNDGKISLGLCR
jgi:hypothetical protein